MGAGSPAVATAVEDTAFAGAEKEGKPEFGCGFSFSMPSPPDSAEDAEGRWGTEAVGGVTGPVVPSGITGAVPVPAGMVKPVDTSFRDGKSE